MLKRTTLFDLDLINDNNFDAVIQSILHFEKEYAVANDKLPLLFTPNVDDVVKLNQKKYATLADELKKSFYILPDGQPIVWASRLLRKPLAKRLPGSELFPLLWKELTKNKKRILLIAPSAEVGDLLKKEYPALQYYVPPFFDADDHEALKKIINELADAYKLYAPQYIFLGIRFPKQNYIALDLIKKIRQQEYIQPNVTMPLFLLLGASYEFYLNIKKRAPVFWQKIGMEWFYRFTQEPGRLFKRYFIDDLQFILIFLKEIFK